MTGSPASASTDRPDGAGDRVVVCGVNWIGDTIMSLPALQAYRAAHPATHLALLVKPGMAGLWAMSPVPDDVLLLEEGGVGLLRTVSRLKAGRFDRAFVLPHSFRSALVPFLARVPDRRGMPGHGRDFMLTRVLPPRGGEGREHQAFEYLDLLAPDQGVPNQVIPDPPALRPDDASMDRARALLAPATDVWIGFIPGAARGPSKQWPAAHFIELGRMLCEREGVRIAVMGAPNETLLCEEVATAVGDGAVSLAGRTDLPTWAAVLAGCNVVACNDSGGMHLAAAVGTPVVALYGITDPGKTGPLGPAQVIQHAERKARDVPRDSEEARLSLASILPKEVYDAVCEALTRI